MILPHNDGWNLLVSINLVLGVPFLHYISHTIVLLLLCILDTVGRTLKEHSRLRSNPVSNRSKSGNEKNVSNILTRQRLIEWLFDFSDTLLLGIIRLTLTFLVDEI